MADELDPVLEARLRGALHAEADAVPFTLRADTVRRVGAERARARRAQRFTWFAAAAAVIALGVAGVSFSLALRSPNDVAASPMPASIGGLASPNLTGLPTYDELTQSAQGKTELGRQEGQAGGQGAQWLISVPQGTRTVEVVVACTGADLSIGTTGANLAVKWIVSAQCNGRPVDLRGIGGGALASDASPSIAIGSGPGTAFRLTVRDEAGTAQSPDGYPAPTPDTNGLATYDALKRELEAGEEVKASMTAEHATSEAGTEVKTWDLGTLAANQGQIAVSCFGTSVTVGFGDGTTFMSSSEERCDPIISVTSLPTNAESGTPHLMVQTLPSVRWRVVAGIVPAAPGSPSPTPDANGVLPLSVLDEALAANGVTPLVGIGSATTEPSVTADENRMGPLPESDVVVAALSCAGTSVVVRVVSAAGSTVADTTQTCDSSLTIMYFDGTKTAGGGEATMVVVPQTGVRWRLAAGVPAVASPSPAALPSWDALHQFIGMDTVIAASGGSSSDSTIDEYLGPLGGRTNLRFVAACNGKISLAWAPASGQPATSFISDFLYCDGAPHMMALPTPPNPPASLQRLVTGDPGSSWMGIVVDLGARGSSAPSASGLLTPANVPATGTTVSSYFGDIATGGTVTLDGGSPGSPSDTVLVSLRCASPPGQRSLRGTGATSRATSRARTTTAAPVPTSAILPLRRGAIAQLGERLNGIQKVKGSNPFSSTNTPLTPTT